MARSRFSPRPSSYGWLLFAGDLGGESVVTADVLSYEVSMQHTLYGGGSVRLACELNGVLQRKGPYPGAALWESLLSWARPDRRLPPDIIALLELVRRHQAEYDDIRESEAVWRALGGT